MVESQFNWDRLWFPPKSQILLVDGYLPDPEGWVLPHLGVQGVRIHDLKDVQCLVMLGVPGMGKTSEMRLAADQARKSGELVDFISLALLSGPTELHAKLLDGQNKLAWEQGGAVWNVFLGGLDEVSHLHERRSHLRPSASIRHLTDL